MGNLTMPVTEEGIVIPNAAARLLGCRTGGWAEIEVRPLPPAEELEDAALYYAAHKLGDAVFVDPPEWVEDGWRLPIRVRGREGTFGAIFLTPKGEVDVARSTSRMELREVVDAPGALPATTR